MLKISMNEYTTWKWTFEEDVHFYANSGYSNIGIALEKILNLSMDVVIRLLRSHKLKVSELCSIGHLVNRSTETQKFYIQEAIHSIELANRLEADTIILLCGYDSLLKNYEDSLSILRQSVEQLLPYAEKYNVRLALETLHPIYKSLLSFIVMLGNAIDFVEEIDSPYLGLWIDTYHVWWDNGIHRNIYRANHKIFGVHINDFLQDTRSLYDWGLPGQGIIPLIDIMRSITQTGWKGPYSIEVISDRHDKNDYSNILDYCNMWAANIEL